jgi:hypothetical protein
LGKVALAATFPGFPRKIQAYHIRIWLKLMRGGKMQRLFALAVIGLIAVPAAHAADAKVEAAVKTFEQISGDSEKLKAYCAMSKKMEEVGEDEKKADAANDEINGYLDALGPDFESAWSAGDELKEGSPDIETLDNALGALDEKCT